MRTVLWRSGMLLGFWGFLSMPASADGPSEGEGWHMMDGWGGDIVMWGLLLIVIGVVIYLMVNRSSQQQSFSKDTETPLDIIKKRYAHGEITREEYEQMKHDVV